VTASADGHSLTAGVVTLRAAMAGDEPFLRELYALGRRDELAVLGWPEPTVRAFCDSQHAIRQRMWRQTSPDAVDMVVVCDGSPVGRLCWLRTQDVIRVIDLATVPAVAGRGIGTRVLSDLLGEADAAGLPVHLHVRTDSPARRLYERLGFTPLETGPADGVYTEMVRPARLTGG
jgi:GNAT superfamily N-acetyltransferase